MTSGSAVALDGPATERRAKLAEPKSWNARNENASRFALLAADLVALLLVFAALVLVRSWFYGPLPPFHWSIFYTATAWLLFRWLNGLYSPCSHFPPTELRLSFETAAGAAIVHAAILFSTDEDELFRLTMLSIWPLVLPLTYALRTLVRTRLIAAGCYGVPIAIVGNGIFARRAIRELHARPELGYVPVALFSSERTAPEEERGIMGVPLVGRSETVADYRFPYPVRHAILTIGQGWNSSENHELARMIASRFPNLQILTNLTGEGHWLSRTRPLGPYLAIETSHARFSFSQRVVKRMLDIAIVLPGLIVAIPFVAIAALAIVIVDPGPVFFSQTREGRNGKPIKIYKLRSMIRNAEAELARHLSENPEARFEYERTMKLRHDPRILPVVGTLIRKASIDELPQLWSILKGDMSLVGPRVMPSREVDLYSERGKELRRDMLPGLTGFWQVEHRNDSDFRVREIADSFYVANWSVWLDLWIILRTVRVVLTGSGAF